MLTSCATTDVFADTDSGPLLAQALLGGLDPLAKECPDDVPCRVEDADLWFAETPAELEEAKAKCVSCPVVPARTTAPRWLPDEHDGHELPITRSDFRAPWARREH